MLTVTDALNRVAFRYAYDLANRPWRIESIDAGLRRIVLDVLGNEVERRDSKGAIILQAYDRLQRPIRLWARDDAGSPVTLRQRMEYGDGGTPDQAPAERAAMRALNLLGQLHRHHDEAGLTTVAAADFKSNVLDKTRRVIADAPILAVFNQTPNGWQVAPFRVDWEPAPQQTLADRESELLETTGYRTTSSVDALNRIKLLQFPQDVQGQRRELRPEYNRAGGLEQVWLDDTLYVERIAYDAKGQRTLIAYGNGVMTRYAYDSLTFRLKRLRSERYSKPDDLSYQPMGGVLQDFGYDYDLVGNILGISDRTPGSGIVNNPEALNTEDRLLAQLLASGNALIRRFSYDPIYRLLSATGRECDQPPNGPPWDDQPRCTDLTQARAYTERYIYDAMGNMLRLEHRNEPGGFTRDFTIEMANNRLRELNVGSNTYSYTFDANGNMRSETTSRHFEWNHSDQMKTFRTQTAGAEPSVHAHYLYDAAGQRVKKLVRKQGGQIEVTHYIDDVFEHHRWSGGTQSGENNHVHVMDDKQRIAIVRLGGAQPGDQGPAVQFHLGDHLASSNVVIDSGGSLVNREEFTPYGETSFGRFARKRYRFTGMERDEESGLSYHGARFYAPWLAKWVSVDPEYLQFPAWSPFSYSFDNPVRFGDPTGRAPQDGDWVEGDPNSWQKGWDRIEATDDMPQAKQTHTYEGAMARRGHYEQRARALAWEHNTLVDQRAELQTLIAEAQKLHFEVTRKVWPNWDTLKTAASVAGVVAACYASAGGCLLAIGVEGYSIIDKKNGDSAKVGNTLYGCRKGVKTAECAIGVVTQVVELGAGAKQKAIDDKTKPAAERLKLKIAQASAERDLLDARITALKKDFSYNRLVSQVWEDWANWTYAGRPAESRPYHESTSGVNYLRYYWKPRTLARGEVPL